MKVFAMVLKRMLVWVALLGWLPLAAQDSSTFSGKPDSVHRHELGIYVGALPAVLLGNALGIQPNGVLYRRAFRNGALRLGAQVWFPQNEQPLLNTMPVSTGDSMVVQKHREVKESQVRAFLGWEWNGKLTQSAQWILVADAQFRYGISNTDLVEGTFVLLPNAPWSLVDDPPMRLLRRQTLATQRAVEVGGGLSFGAGIRVPIGKRFTLHTLTRANVQVQTLKKTEIGLVGILPANSTESRAFYFDMLMPMAELGVAYRF